LTDELSKLLGVDVAIETEAGGGKEFATVSRITGDVRDLLGVEEAKKVAGAGGEAPASVAGTIKSVDGMLQKYDPQIGTILDKVPPLQDSATRTLEGVADTLEDNKEHINEIIADVGGITKTVNDELNTVLVELAATLEKVK